MQSELDLLKQRITELEDENAEVKAKNVELKHENTKLKQIIEENAEFKAKIIKLERAIVDTTIRPCLSIADVIRSDVNQESSVEASESSVSYVSDSPNSKGNISISPTSTRADMIVPKPLTEKVSPKIE
ncbi:10802_t:CDS:2, partial [Racocetra persica]